MRPRISKPLPAALIALALGLSTSAVWSADLVFDFPAGWQRLAQDPLDYSARNNNVALMLEGQTGGWRVMQVRDLSQVVYTELANRPHHLLYSPTGQHLLVAVSAGEGEQGGHQWRLLDAQGTVLWTHRNQRFYSFSTTGEVVYAWDEFLGKKSHTIDVFDVSTGHFIRRWRIEGPLKDVEVVGNGDQIIEAFSWTVTCVSAGANEAAWTLDFDPETGGPLGALDWASVFSIIDSETLLVRRYLGPFTVIRTDGTVVATFNDWGLKAAQPEIVDHGPLNPVPGPEPNMLLLVEGSALAIGVCPADGVRPACDTFRGAQPAKAFLLDLANPTTLEPYPVDATAPPGFTLMDYRQDAKFIFLSATQLLIRVLPPRGL